MHYIVVLSLAPRLCDFSVNAGLNSHAFQRESNGWLALWMPRIMDVLDLGLDYAFV